MSMGLESVLESTTAERLAAGFKFTEGPLWHPDGFYYFVDIRRNNLHRVTPGQAPELVRANTGEGNGTTFDLQGRLVICEGGNRRVTRWTADGRSEVLMDRFEGKRLNRPNDVVCKSDGSIYFTDPGLRVPLAEREVIHAGVYRIAPDGLWDQLWESRDDAPYDLTFADNGSLIVGTGNKGKIYRLDGDPVRPTLLARAGAQQVTSFYKDGRGRLYYATANPGKLFRLSSERATRGTYESDPRDAQMVSTWGTLTWHGVMSGGNQIEVFTRSGNTETPDETWSPWSAAYKTPDGSAITSPKARYLQWRAVLTGRGDGPVLTSVTAAYLQRNLRPQVRSITIHPPGIVFQKPLATGEPDLAGFDDQSTPDRRLSSAALSGQQGTANSPPLGRRTYQKGLQTLVWKADDENEDDLLYDVLYRRDGETSWRVLRRALQEPILVWDTTTVPNGTYFLKIVASDLPSNAAGLALTG